MMPCIEVDSLDFRRWDIFEQVDETFLKSVTKALVFNVYSRAVMVTSDGRVWGLGDNSLGIIAPNLGRILYQPAEIEDLRGKIIKNICYGEGHILVLTSKGEILAWGMNQAGQLGLNGVYYAEQPTLVEQLSEVQDIVVGPNHSVALTSSGQVFCWGSSDGFAGIPEQVIFPEGTLPIASIAAGEGHTFALTEDGQVFGWGSNCLGELCLPANVKESKTAVKIEGLPRIVKLASGACNGWALSAKGELFGWGNNEKDWMGLENLDYPARVPSKVKIIPKVLDIVGGGYIDEFCAQTAEGFYRWDFYEWEATLKDFLSGRVTTREMKMVECQNIAECLMYITPCINIRNVKR